MGASLRLLHVLLLLSQWQAAAAASGGDDMRTHGVEHQEKQDQPRRRRQNEQQQRRRPNFIIFQPDDYPHYEQWSPPPHFPGNDPIPYTIDLPNTERLRTSRHSIQMTQAYAASSVCGTSRYATMTGRYPCRSSHSRFQAQNEYRSWVTIPMSLLRDIDETDETTGDDGEEYVAVKDGMDCSSSNLAQILKANGYATGFAGKWHLSGELRETPYDEMRAIVEKCGFDYAEAIYRHNLDKKWVDYSREETGSDFSHNMEYVTMKALEFIEQYSTTGTGDNDTPFFLYVNPTVPHSANNVYNSLVSHSCRDTPEGPLLSDPYIPGMTANFGGSCRNYRRSVLERAAGQYDDATLGCILVDDAIGAILQGLEQNGQLDNTFFLFQPDHGQEGKWSLYEPGIRIPQFVHYPDGFDSVEGQEFDGVVGTIDLAPTILDYAGINKGSPGYYEMDGISWRDAVTSSSSSSISNYFRNERCIFAELMYDRALICGRCYKYLEVDPDWPQTQETADEYGWVEIMEDGYYDLCDDGRKYITAPADNREGTQIKDDESMLKLLQERMECHLTRTDPGRSDEIPDYNVDCGDKRPPTETALSTSGTSTGSKFAEDAAGGSSGPSTGLIVGIVVAAVIALLAALALILYRRRDRQLTSPQPLSPSKTSASFLGDKKEGNQLTSGSPSLAENCDTTTTTETHGSTSVNMVARTREVSGGSATVDSTEQPNSWREILSFCGLNS